jgi:hypothetical protein
MPAAEAEQHVNNLSLPASKLAEIAGQHTDNPEIMQAIAKHPNAGPQALDIAYRSDMADSALEHPNVSQKTVEHAFNRFVEPNEPKDLEYEHKDIALHPKLPQEKKDTLVMKIMNSKDKGTWSDMIANNYFDKGHASEAMVQHALQHPDVDYTAHALQSPTVSDEHVKTAAARKDFDYEQAKKAIENKALSPESIAFLYNKFRGKEGENTYWRDKIEGNLTENPNTPPEIISKLASKRSPHRRDAMQHPAFPEKELHNMVKEGDEDAIDAALPRSDTPEEVLRHIHAHLPDDANYKWGKGRSLVRHPNYPEDLQLKSAKGSTDEARALLKREQLSKPVLDQLVSHKNTNLAVDALKHKAITPETVLLAYNRKAKDVAGAAGLHRLLPKELKINRAVENEDTAVKLADISNDKDVLRSIAERWGNKDSVRGRLLRNHNLDGDTLHNLVSHQIQATGSRATYFPNNLDEHPNMKPETRMMMIKHPSASYKAFSHINLTPDEAREGLRHWATEDRDLAGDYATGLLTHPNTDPELAKEIVSGTYGKLNNRQLRSDELEEFVKSHPLVYTKGVVKAALETPHELTDKNAVGQIAKGADSLSAKDIAEYVDGVKKMKFGGDRDKEDFYHSVAVDMVRNPNADPHFLVGLVDRSLNNSQQTQHDIKLANAAIHNPSYPKKHLEEIIRHPKFPEDNGNLRGDLTGFIKDKIYEPEMKELRDKALVESNHPQFVTDLLTTRFKDQEDPKLVEKALSNPHPEVVKDVLGYLSNKSTQMSGANDSRSRQIRDYVDQLADHADPSVRAAAFEMMSPEAQAKMTQGQDLMSNPELIQGLSRENAEKLKIESHHSLDAIQQLLKHKYAHWQHFEQAVNHSQEGAELAHKILSAKIEGEDRPSKKDVEGLGYIQEKLLDKYSDSSASRFIARTTPNTLVLDKIVNDPRLFNKFGGNITENDHALSRHLDSFTKLKGESHASLMSDLAAHPKASTKLLEHIAANYPEEMVKVAGHPKAYSSKVLRTILTSGNKEAIKQVANNDKVPDEVREQLKRDPEIMLNLDGKYVTPDDLTRAVPEADAHRLEQIVDHRSANDEVYNKVLDAVDSGRFSDEEKQITLNNVADKRNLSKTTIDRIISHTNATSRSISHVLSKNNVDNEQFNKIVDRFDSDQPVMAYLADNLSSWRDGDVGQAADRLIDHIDVGAEPNLVSQLISNQHGKLHPQFFDKTLSKLEAARGPQYQYTDKPKSMLESDGELLSHIAEFAPTSLHGKLVQYPELQPMLLRSGNINKTSYDKMVEDLPRLHEIAAKSDSDYLKKRFVEEHIKRLVDSPHSDESAINLIYKTMVDKQTPEENGVMVSAILSSPKAPSKLIDDMFKAGNIRALRSPKLSRHIVDEQLSNLTMTNSEDLAQNPNVSMGDLNKAVKDKRNSPVAYRDAYGTMLSRPSLRSEDLEQLYDMFSKNKGALPTEDQNYLTKRIIQRPEVTESIFNDAYGKGLITNDQAYSNPKWGGRLFRAMDHRVPSGVPNLTTKTPVTNQQVLKPRMEKLQSVASMVPPEGYIDWATFKKDNPSMAGDPLVQRMFTSAPKQRLTQEHAQKYLSEVPGKEFHMSYTKWTGMQRHRSVPQLVVQVNNGSFMDDVLAKDPEAYRLYSFMQQASKNSGHPTTPQSIGWSRVDTGDKDHWFIDEVQSDFGAGVARELSKIQENPEHATAFASKVGIPVEKAQKVLHRLVDVMQGWDRALVEHVIDLAKRNGVKQVSMHSGKSKTVTNKGGESEITNKYDKLYNKMPQEMGFHGDFYKNLPVATDKSLMEQPVWTLNIPQEIKKSEYDERSVLVKAGQVISKLKNEEVQNYSPEAFQAALEAVQALVQVLKESGYTSPGHADVNNHPSVPGETSPRPKEDKPLTHQHKMYSPGAVRMYDSHEERQKTPEGKWVNVSRQGDT